jgi:hypothetical protein
VKEVQEWEEEEAEMRTKRKRKRMREQKMRTKRYLSMSKLYAQLNIATIST